MKSKELNEFVKSDTLPAGLLGAGKSKLSGADAGAGGGANRPPPFAAPVDPGGGAKNEEDAPVDGGTSRFFFGYKMKKLELRICSIAYQGRK